MKPRRDIHQSKLDWLVSPEQVAVSSSTIACEHHPERNEDSSFTLQRTNGLLVGAVFDGLGGHEGSEQASRTANALVQDAYTTHAPYRLSRREAEEFARAALLDANAEINRSGRYIATTAVLASVHEDTDTIDRYVNIAWAGDSRAYVFRDGQLVYRTLDDGIAIYVPELGELYPEVPYEYQLQTYLETVHEPIDDSGLDRLFMHRNVIENCLGAGERPTIHTTQLSVAPGDTVLVCSDGVHDNLTNDEIQTIIRNGGGVEELTAAALARSRDSDHMRAKPDDITAVLMSV